jgi:hypothetical protein
VLFWCFKHGAGFREIDASAGVKFGQYRIVTQFELTDRLFGQDVPFIEPANKLPFEAGE